MEAKEKNQKQHSRRVLNILLNINFGTQMCKIAKKGRSESWIIQQQRQFWTPKRSHLYPPSSPKMSIVLAVFHPTPLAMPPSKLAGSISYITNMCVCVLKINSNFYVPHKELVFMNRPLCRSAIVKCVCKALGEDATADGGTVFLQIWLLPYRA